MDTRTNVVVPENGSGMPDEHEDFLTPQVDVYETGDAYVLLLDLPGATKESILLTMQKDALTVKAEVRPRHEASARLISREIAAQGFYREFRLGEEIDANVVDAHFDLGVLTVKLQKREESKPHEIRIQ